MLYTVDPKLCIVTFGTKILTGWGEDMFEFEMVDDSYSEMVGCTGETARIPSNNNNAKGKLTFLQTSPSNDYLSVVSLRDRKLGSGVLPFSMVDALGTTRVFSPMAYLKKPTKVDMGKSIKTREWEIYLVDVEYYVGGNVPTF